jgi:uncharacterized delta-60 repeat protein
MRLRRFASRVVSVNPSVSLLEPRLLLAGEVDPAFGVQVATDFGLRGDVALDVVEQADHKLLVAGYTRGSDPKDTNLAVARYNSDGTLDATFGNGVNTTTGFVTFVGDGGGRVTVDYNDPNIGDPGPSGSNAGVSASKVLVQPDGRIILSVGIGGAFGKGGVLSIARLDPDGSPDLTFDGDGLAEFRNFSTPTTHILEKAGDLAFTRDAAGNVNGYLISATQELYAPGGGETIDQNWLLARYTLAGTLDPAFGSGGRVVTDFAGAGFIDPDTGDPVVDPVINTARSWDESWAIEALPDGKILQAGGNEVLRRLTPAQEAEDLAEFGVKNTRFRNAVSFVRYNPDGSVDATYGGTRYFRAFGRATTSAVGQPGTTTVEMVAQPRGAADEDKWWTKPFVNVRGLATDAGGRILAAGAENFRTSFDAPKKNASRILAYCLTPDGALDPAFGGDGIFEGLPANGRSNPQDEPTSIASRDDRVIIVGKTGEGEVIRAPGEFLVLQLKPDGTPDTAFAPDGAKTLRSGAAMGRFNAAAIQADGKLVAVGQSGQGVDPTSDDFVVARFNTDGSLDGGFGEDPSVVPDMTVLTTSVAPDGKILAVGYRDTLDGRTFAIIRRYTADGGPDPDFAPVTDDSQGRVGTVGDLFKGGADFAHAAAVAPDGSVYVTGVSAGKLAVARLTPAGARDTSFDAGDDDPATTRNESDGVRLFDVGASGGSNAGYGVVALPGGGALVTGESDGKWLLLKVRADGTLDGSFAGGGVRVVEFDPDDDFGPGSGEDAAVMPLLAADGRFLVAGTRRLGDERWITLMRFDAVGTLDQGFSGPGGKSTSFTTAVLGIDDDPFNRLDARSVAIDAGGRIVVAGAAGDDAGVERYLPTGELDSTFGEEGQGWALFDWGGVDDPDSIVFGDGGQILLTGTVGAATDAVPVVAAVTPDGRRWAAFGYNGVRPVEPVPQQSPGRTFRNGGTTRSTSGGGQDGNVVFSARRERDGAGRSPVRRLIATDTAGATAAMTNPASVLASGGTALTFQVVYSDDVAIDVSSIGVDDVTVTSPGGAALPVVSARVLQAGNGAPRTAEYTVNAPGGTFDEADNGTYAVAAVAGAVRDTSNNPLAGGALGSFSVNIVPPVATGPDLTIAFAAPVAGAFVGGARGRALVVVTNAAGADLPANPSTVALYLSADGFVDATDRLLAVATVRTLKQGKTVRAKAKRIVFPDDLPAGTYHVLARADDGNAVSEKSETNNTADGGTITLAPPFTDAVPVSVSSVKVKGTRGSVTLLVRNDGNVPIKGNITGTVFASPDGTLDAGDTNLGTYSVRGSVKPGATRRLKVKFTPPTGLTGGFTLIATAVAPGDPTPEQSTVLGGVFLP